MTAVILILILTTWFGIAYLTMKIAQSQGRSEGTAFLLGLLFGLFAVLGYLIAGDSEGRKMEILAKGIRKGLARDENLEK